MTSETSSSNDAARGLAASMEQVTEFVSQFARVANSEACIGPAETANGHTVIPVASVSVQGGFGLAFGGGNGGGGTGHGQGGGGGGGGGGRGASRVIALVDVSEEGVRVKPVLDVTTLGLGVMVLGAIALLSKPGGFDLGKRLLPFMKSAPP